jgi:hypothetical protein
MHMRLEAQRKDYSFSSIPPSMVFFNTGRGFYKEVHGHHKLEAYIACSR